MGQRFYRIKADSLQGAYEKMRARFGEEATVVNTRQIVEGGVLGFFGRKRVEVTASVPAAVKRPISAVEKKYAAQSGPLKEPEMNETVKFFEQVVRDAQARMLGKEEEGRAAPAQPTPLSHARPRPEAVSAQPAPRSDSPVLAFPAPKKNVEKSDNAVQRELQELREMMQVIYAESPGAGLPTEFAPHYRTLVDRGVSRKAAAALIGAVVKHSDFEVMRDPRVFSERLHFEIRKAVSITGGIALHGGQCRVVALCGATGVGKTTNIAKLAAHFAVHERARVALITADTYRIAAPEQLRVYASIIGLPFKVVNDARELRDALTEFRQYDLVLMDTAGGSQFNLEQINELKGLLAAAQPQETILVMGANTQAEDLQNISANFNCLHPTSLMFTKLDETRQYGAMLSLIIESALPLAYLSIGQNVPDDIRVANPGMIANLVLEGKDNRG